MTTARYDAVGLFKADHRKVEDLFARFEAAKGIGTKQRLAKQICSELTVHAIIEEETFIPHAKARSMMTWSMRLMSSTTAPRC